jgi:hypothetical protein
MDPTRPLVADVWAGASPSGGRGVPYWSHTRFMSPKSLAPRQRCQKMRGANSELEGRLNIQRPIILRHFLRCRIRLRIRRFLRPTLRRPLPRRRLAMRSPLGIGEGTRHDCETNRTNFRPGKNTDSIPNDLIVSRSTSRRFSGDWRSSRGSQPSHVVAFLHRSPDHIDPPVFYFAIAFGHRRKFPEGQSVARSARTMWRSARTMRVPRKHDFDRSPYSIYTYSWRWNRNSGRLANTLSCHKS